VTRSVTEHHHRRHRPILTCRALHDKRIPKRSSCGYRSRTETRPRSDGQPRLGCVPTRNSLNGTSRSI
jgi:hypothetical protein